jgi:hypothetical protein
VQKWALLPARRSSRSWLQPAEVVNADGLLQGHHLSAAPRGMAAMQQADLKVPEFYLFPSMSRSGR